MYKSEPQKFLDILSMLSVSEVWKNKLYSSFTQISWVLCPRSWTHCNQVIDDVERLDSFQDGFICYQVLRFCQTTRLLYLRAHILLGKVSRNRCILRQEHVDCKNADKFLKKWTKKHTDDWDTVSKTWVNMVLYLSHAEGGFWCDLYWHHKTMFFILLLHDLYLDYI